MARKIEVIKLQVVPLPFVPVTPIMGAGQALKNKLVTEVTLAFLAKRLGEIDGVRTIRSALIPEKSTLSPILMSTLLGNSCFDIKVWL